MTLFFVSELAEVISGGTPKTNDDEYWGGNIPWLSVKDFNNASKYVYKTEKSITKFGLEHSATNLLAKDDIIISARGTIGEIAMLSRPMAFNQSCFGIRARNNINQHFLFYALKNSLNKLKALSQGSVFSTINRSTFKSWEIEIPSLEIQQKIAEVLSYLDNKISINNRINDYLAA